MRCPCAACVCGVLIFMSASMSISLHLSVSVDLQGWTEKQSSRDRVTQRGGRKRNCFLEGVKREIEE